MAAAAKSGCVPVIEALLAKGANPNVAEVVMLGAANSTLILADRTPLFYAAEANQVEAAKALLAKGAKVDAKDKDGMTPLMAAATTDNGADVVKLLLATGANVNVKTKRGATALLLAAKGGSAANVKHLLDAGADIKSTDSPQNDALSCAAQAGNCPVLAELLKLPFGQASKNRALQIAAIMGVRNGRLDAVNLLLDNGADPNVKDTKGMSVIQFAAASENDGLVKLLAQAGAKDRPKGYTPETGEADQPPDSKTMTRADWRKLVAPFDATSRDFGSKFLNEAGFQRKFGKPARTDKVRDTAYWYYECSDGILQVVIKADFLEQQGIVVIEAINEYGEENKDRATPQTKTGESGRPAVEKTGVAATSPQHEQGNESFAFRAATVIATSGPTGTLPAPPAKRDTVWARDTHGISYGEGTKPQAVATNEKGVVQTKQQIADEHLEALVGKEQTARGKAAEAQIKTELLVRAAKRGLNERVKLYLARGSDVNETDREGNTPLIAACQAGHVDTVQALLDKGASVTATNADGQVALDVTKDQAIIDLLKKHTGTTSRT